MRLNKMHKTLDAQVEDIIATAADEALLEELNSNDIEEYVCEDTRKFCSHY